VNVGDTSAGVYNVIPDAGNDGVVFATSLRMAEMITFVFVVSSFLNQKVSNVLNSNDRTHVEDLKNLSPIVRPPLSSMPVCISTHGFLHQRLSSQRFSSSLRSFVGYRASSAYFGFLDVTDLVE